MKGFHLKYLIILALFEFSLQLIAGNSNELSPRSGLKFTENKGQISDQYNQQRKDILFAANYGEMSCYFKKGGFSYQLYKVDSWKTLDSNDTQLFRYRGLGNKVPLETSIYRLDINIKGANPNTKVIAENKLEEYYNYYTEACPEGATHVGNFSAIKYKNIYSGIDLHYYNKNGALKYDYIVKPGHDYRKIKLEISGAKKIEINDAGELEIETPLGKITEQKPLVFQNGKLLSASWKCEGNLVSFEIENINPNQELVIDPLVRLWSTYFGGSSYDELWYTDIGPSGDIYVSGISRSLNNIATSGAYQTTYAGGGQWGDATLARFTPAGNLVWATYYGGNGDEYCNAHAIDANENIYMIGGSTTTLTGVIATAGSYKPYNSGGSWGDVFLVKFTSSGTRQWGTYYGGTSQDWGCGCSVDNSGNVFISGGTNSTESNLLTTPGCHQNTYAGGARDCFLAKFSSSGGMLWGTYFGGAGYDNGGFATKTDAVGNVYIIGSTQSQSGIATPAAFQSVYGGNVNFGGYGDGYIAKFNSTGQVLWSTYYGGLGDDYLCNIDINGAGDLLIAGIASTPSSTYISTPNSFQPNYGGGPRDAFLLKFTPSGQRIWCSFYGGSGIENWDWCSVDLNDNVYLLGMTNSTNNISTPCSYQPSYGGGVYDFFIAKFNANGNRDWGTYYGGAGSEEWLTSITDASGNLYLSGAASANSGTVMASATSYQPIFGGGSLDGFVTKFGTCIPEFPSDLTPASNMTVCSGKHSVLTASANCSIQWFNSLNSTGPIGFGNVFSTPVLTTTTTFYAMELSCGNTTTRTAITVTVIPSPSIAISAEPPVVCAGNSTTLTPVNVITYTWVPSAGLNLSNTLTAVASPSQMQSYSVQAYDGTCNGMGVITISVVQYPNISVTPYNSFICEGNSINLSLDGAQSYSWFPASGLNTNTSGSVISSPSANVVYTVFAANMIDTVSCVKQTTLDVYVVPYINVSIANSATICSGESAFLQANGGNIFYWYPNSFVKDPNNRIAEVFPTETTVFTVSASSNGMCPTTATTLVKINPLPFIDAGVDTSYNVNDVIYVAALTSGSLTWYSENNDIVCPTCSISQVFPEKSSCYEATAVNEFGCVAKDMVCIDITKDYSYYIPNSFTPNDDGLNDEFKVYGNGLIDIDMRIFDRWGNALFHSNDINIGWNGKYKNAVCQEGSYIYKIIITGISGKKEELAGQIVLLKE